MAIAITGTYYHRTGWVDANWSRMQLAHDTNEPKALDSDFLYAGTFNVSITSVDGASASDWVPPDDNTYRQQAHDLGVARGNLYSNGSDFLSFGNYINPDVAVVTIQGFPVSNGQLYYAGSTDSFTPSIQPIDRHSLETMAEDQISTSAGLICSNTIDDGNIVLVELNDVINWKVDYCCIDCADCSSIDCGSLYFCNEPTVVSVTALDCACPAYEIHFADGNILTRPDDNPYQFYSCSKTQLCGCSLPNCMNVITSGTTGYIPDMQINLIRANYWEASGTYDFESCCGAGACTEQWQASYDPLTCILTVSAFQMEYGGNMVTNPSGQSFIYTADLSVLGCSLPITLDYVGGASGCSHDSTIQVDVC